MSKILLVFILLLGFISIISAGCPGLQEAEIGIDVFKEPSIFCIKIDATANCAPGSDYHLFINNNCSEEIIYIQGNGTSHKLNSTWPYFQDDDIPQEVGLKWNRTIYFKGNPEEKIVVRAINYPYKEYNTLLKRKYDFCGDEEGYWSKEKSPLCFDTHKLSEFKDSEKYPENNSIYWIVGLIAIFTIGILIYLAKKRR